MKKIIVFFTFIVAVLSINGSPLPFTLFNLTEHGLNVVHKGEVVYIPPNSYKKFEPGIKVILKNPNTGATRGIKTNPGKTLIINH